MSRAECLVAKQDIDDIVAAALEYYGETGELRNAALPTALERDQVSSTAAAPTRSLWTRVSSLALASPCPAVKGASPTRSGRLGVGGGCADVR